MKPFSINTPLEVKNNFLKSEVSAHWISVSYKLDILYFELTVYRRDLVIC